MKRPGIRLSMLAALAVVTGLTVSAAHAVAGSDDPVAIMEKVFRTTTDGKRKAHLQMTIADGAGRERVRTMLVRSMRVADARKTFVLIDSPADARGTGFVSVDYDDTHKDGERWFFLPSLGRSTRIGNTQMSGAFMGSDFSYGELSQPNPKLFNFSLTSPSVTVDGEDCWLITAKPVDEDAKRQMGYASLEMWVSKSKLSTMRVRAELSEDHKTKYIKASDFKLVGKQWVPHRVEARTVAGEKLLSKTVLVTLETESGENSASEEDFTKRRLEQGL